MLTGVEIAGTILATFPLIISALEHYERGFQPIKEWIRFRGEFATFLNALVRQKIFFRQNMEELLSPIISSDYEMSVLLDNPGGSAWTNMELNDKLRRRLPGKYEYECYTTTVSYILEVLEKLKGKLKIAGNQPLWIEHSSSTGRLRMEYEMKRIIYTLSKKRREALMCQLEKHNSEIQTLLGNSEKLEPMRRKRKSPITGYFHQIRSQAQSLHTALARAWRCEDSSAHSTKLLLEKRVKSDVKGEPEIDDTFAIKFNLFFCHGKQTLASRPSDWSAVEIKMVGPVEDISRRRSRSTDTGSRPSLWDASRQRTSDITLQGSNASDAGGRKITFLEDDAKSTTLSVGDDAPQIMDLCSALQDRLTHQIALGYLKDPQERLHSVSLVEKPQLEFSEMRRVLSLDEILGSEDGRKKAFPRRKRLEIAVILANSMLQLHTGPWLCDRWGKRDIYFFQSHDGFIHTDHPFLVCNFTSDLQVSGTESDRTRLERSSGSCNSSLLSLGILILELWFNQTIESQPFRNKFQGPDGNDNEYTDFNTAQKWQEQAMEEAGLDLHNSTRRCIYCAFGAVSQDLEDEELRRAVYSEVVQPLEKLLERFDGTP